MPTKRTTKKPIITGEAIGWDGKPVGKQEAKEAEVAARKEQTRQQVAEQRRITSSPQAIDAPRAIGGFLATPVAHRKVCIECHNPRKRADSGYLGYWCSDCYAAMQQGMDRDRAKLKERIIVSGVPPEFALQWAKERQNNKDNTPEVQAYIDDIIENGD